MTLTQAAIWTKKIITGGAILLVSGLFMLLIFNLYQQFMVSRQPKPGDIPENRFGALPAVNFPSNQISSSNYSYSMDTETGQLPVAPKLMKIYFIPRTGVSLLAPDRSKQLAEKLGFPNGPETVSATVYRFNDGNGGNITIDLTTANFRFDRPAKGIPEQNPGGKPLTLPGKDRLVQLLRNYLDSMGILPAELQASRFNVIYNNGAAETSDQAVVTLWPDNIDKVPIQTASFTNGLVRATVSKLTPDQISINKVDYTYWPIDKTTSSTYLLKTPDQAFADLRSGSSFVAVQPPDPKVSLTAVYLAYFETEDYSPYLQPVYVFQGPNFAAAVPAIDTKVLLNPTPLPTATVK